MKPSEPAVTPTPLYEPAMPPCACGHGFACHDIGTRQGVKVRTACAHGLGPRGTPCPCRTYTQPRPPSAEEPTQ